MSNPIQFAERSSNSPFSEEEATDSDDAPTANESLDAENSGTSCVVGTHVLSKVVAVTLSFWMAKILATTLGETAGDYLSMTLNLGYYISLGITFAILAVILVAQIRARRYHPVLFWAAIVGTTTAGTEVSDWMDRSLGLGYAGGSLILAGGLALVMAIWWFQDRDLSVYPIVKRDVEIKFWLAVLLSNSLGTAFGDYLTNNAGLSYVQGALVTGAVIGVVLVLHYATRMNAILLFWIAFIFTRPFGATFGDLLTKPVADGGMNLPRETASLITAGLLIGVVSYSAWQARRSARSELLPSQ